LLSLQTKEFYSKLLFGKLRIISFDWDLNSPAVYPRPANQVRDQIISNTVGPNSTSIVQPHDSNLHSIIALETSAFIDFIGPPYDEDFRPCTYFKPVSSSASNVNTVMLHPYDPQISIQDFQLSYVRADPYLIISS
jgi:hypothetical protein